ncbi:hypothetical protein TNIN_154901 [Trichonephila inaurata madagascariensis]|uniref:Uncharacterized protein n=1 Tax=Trichonephila inaurata madagascariensis TaxID=2747483 RepID=A0A8X6WP10_9ARAC|nr:hypothetical protein TNIN_154901 [Trichonephila inaurata madagascariensis]
MKEPLEERNYNSSRSTTSPIYTKGEDGGVFRRNRFTFTRQDNTENDNPLLVKNCRRLLITVMLLKFLEFQNDSADSQTNASPKTNRAIN